MGAYCTIKFFLFHPRLGRNLVTVQSPGDRSAPSFNSLNSDASGLDCAASLRPSRLQLSQSLQSASRALARRPALSRISESCEGVTVAQRIYNETQTANQSFTATVDIIIPNTRIYEYNYTRRFLVIFLESATRTRRPCGLRCSCYAARRQHSESMSLSRANT